MTKPLIDPCLILACFIIATLLTTPTMAQQNGAPELTPEASQAIDKGLKYLLSTQHKDASRK